MPSNLGRMMIGVGFIGLALSAARVHEVLGLVTAAVSGLALVRTFRIIDGSGRMAPVRVLAVFGRSLAVAFVLLAGALIPGLFMGVVGNADRDPTSLRSITGLALAGMMALAVLPYLRRRWW